MIAGMLLTKAQVHKTLIDNGFIDTSEVFDGIVPHRFWKSPWGENFSVPDEDFVCAAWTLKEIIESVNLSKPTQQ